MAGGYGRLAQSSSEMLVVSKGKSGCLEWAMPDFPSPAGRHVLL
jgi:hypothetical protein